MEVVSDIDLVRLISTGDRSAFAVLYKKYLNNLYNYIFSICFDKETTEEILQGLFVKLWEDRENIVFVKEIKPYLYKSAKNRLLNHLHKKRTEFRIMEELVGKTTPYDRKTEDSITYSEYYLLAMNAIEMLPKKRKQIFLLRMDHDLSLDDIASHLHISKSVVKKQLYSGINFVKKYLHENADIILTLLLMMKI